MKSKSITIYAFVISFVFAAAVFFFGYSLCREYAGGSERTGYEFDNLVHSVSLTLAAPDSSVPDYTELFSTICGSFEEYSFITLKNESSLLYVYPDASVSSVANTSPFCRVYASSFTADGVQYVLTASMYLLRPSSIFYYARFAFLVILAGTMFAAVLILYMHLSEQNTGALAAAGTTEEAYEPDPDDSAAPDEREPAEEKIIREDDPETSPEPAAVPSDQEPEAAFSDETPPAPPVQKTKPQNPEGLFSPLTGFGWEQYLETRLDSELVRAASSEQDISLFIIRIPTMTFDHALTPKICAYLSDEFLFKDMLFEYKNDGFAAVRANTAVDEAVSFADSVYAGISDILTKNGTDLKCAIGISSRSVRMLPGSRLIQEAAEALEHAFAEPEFPIIAFRANADKYRKFIETKDKD